MNKNCLFLLTVAIFSMMPLQGHDKELLVAPTISIGTGLGMFTVMTLAYVGCGAYVEMRKAAREFKKNNSPKHKEQWGKARSIFRKLLASGTVSAVITIGLLLKDLKNLSEYKIARIAADERSLTARRAEEKARHNEVIRGLLSSYTERQVAEEAAQKREVERIERYSRVSDACKFTHLGDFSQLEKAVKDAEATKPFDDDNNYRSQALCYALKTGDKEMAAYLLDPNCSIYTGLDEQGLMRLALGTGSPEAVAFALEYGAEYSSLMETGEEPKIMDRALMNKDFVLARNLAKHGIMPNNNFMATAIIYGYIDVVDFLIKEGMLSINAVDEAGDTPLLACAKEGKASDHCICAALARGANVEARDRNGFTPLIIAAKEGRQRLALLFLDKGRANINARSDGLTALGHAVRGGHVAVVKDLLKRGAVVDDTIRDELARLLPGDSIEGI